MAAADAARAARRLTQHCTGARIDRTVSFQPSIIGILPSYRVVSFHAARLTGLSIERALFLFDDHDLPAVSMMPVPFYLIEIYSG